MRLGHNNPPRYVIPLDKDEFEYLEKLMPKAKEADDQLFKELWQMSSSDERANSRSLLSMALTADIVMKDCIIDKMKIAKEDVI